MSARWTPQQPTLNPLFITHVTESFLHCCSQAVQRYDLGAGDDQTGFPSLPENPAQGCNYLCLKSESSLTPQVCSQHLRSLSVNHVFGSSRDRVQLTGNGREEWSWSMGVLLSLRMGGKEHELLQARSCFFWQHGG